MNYYQRATQGVQNVGAQVGKNLAAGQKGPSATKAGYSINPLKGTGKAFTSAFKKMAPAAIAKRKRSTVANAAGKTMGGLFSK